MIMIYNTEYDEGGYSENHIVNIGDMSRQDAFDFILSDTDIADIYFVDILRDVDGDIVPQETMEYLPDTITKAKRERAALAERLKAARKRRGGLPEFFACLAGDLFTAYDLKNPQRRCTVSCKQSGSWSVMAGATVFTMSQDNARLAFDRMTKRKEEQA